MADTGQQDTAHLVELTAEVVASYVANNSVQKGDIAGLISAVHGALKELGAPVAAPAPERPRPPVSVKKSLGDDFLISMEDGRRYKSLKRHLSGRGLTPAQYREKWGLPLDYPMVAPSYARQRSELAKSIGLGRQRSKSAASPRSGNGQGRGRRSGRAA